MKILNFLILAFALLMPISAKANFMPIETVYLIKNDMIINKYKEDGCKIEKEADGFTYTCKNTSGYIQYIESISCNNFQIAHRYKFNAEYNFRCKNFKDNINTNNFTQNNYDSFFNRNKNTTNTKFRKQTSHQSGVYSNQRW